MKQNKNRKLDTQRKSKAEFHPKNDGINHINVYLRGKTKKGRILSNFAKTPFKLYGRQFQSVESFYQSHLSYHEDIRERISKSRSSKARYYRKVEIKDGDPVITWDERVIIYKSRLWEEEIKKAIKAKIYQNLKVKRALLATGDLPLTNYCVKQGKVISYEDFLPDFLMEVRGCLKGLKTKEYVEICEHTLIFKNFFTSLKRRFDYLTQKYNNFDEWIQQSI
ncbi:MAG: Bacteriophage protein GP30.3 [Candidatus Scalindua rubra]|uniref:Bacteriophage protein GP30.3 n=1 Tax=Candidatus Scalindua rubra TaxID=1872076 RepID=A0A1E3X956_9BACT|nr:MAG: Bacteriophage protein GP30.3 [Candidatus Scalindua rubra]